LSFDLDDDVIADDARIDFVEMLLFGRSWLKDRACKDVPETVFFPESTHRGAYGRAREICASCHVREECLDDALQVPVTEDTTGFRGGASPKDRYRMIRPTSCTRDE
jgi:hypothetical protein